MAQLTADFEAGVNGNNVLTSDTGSADAWNTSAVAGSGTRTYDTAHPAFGSLALKLVAGSAGGTVVGWTTGIAAATDHYGRCYLYLTANPSGAHPIIQLSSASTRVVRIDLMSDGKLRMLDAPASGIQSSTNSVALNQLIRIEWHIIHSVTVGQVEIKLFNTASSTTPTETMTSPANWNTGAAAGGIVFGNPQTGATGHTIWWDSIIANAAAYPGHAVPVNTVAPVASGTATVGQTLSSTTGTWTGDATIAYTYQWQRDNTGGGSFSNIASATASTYALVNADDACNVRRVVTATNTPGNASANSNQLGAVVEPVPTNSVAPAVTGTTAVGDTLTCSTGTWANQGGTIATYTYQWKRDGVNIAGQTASTHVIVSADQGHALTCAVTATNTGGAGTAATSNSTAISSSAHRSQPVPQRRRRHTGRRGR